MDRIHVQVHENRNPPCPRCGARLVFYDPMFPATIWYKKRYECDRCEWKKTMEEIQRDGGLDTPRRRGDEEEEGRAHNTHHKHRHNDDDDQDDEEEHKNPVEKHSKTQKTQSVEEEEDVRSPLDKYFGSSKKKK